MLYLIIGDVDGYIECSSTEENNGNKYLTFASTDKNKKVLKNIQSFGMELNIISSQQMQANPVNAIPFSATPLNMKKIT